MSLVTFNGLPVLALDMNMSLRGAWTADIAVLSDSGETPTDMRSGTIECEGQQFKCTTRALGKYRDTYTLRCVGGAGGLGKPGPVKSYNQVQASVPVGDVLRAAGESLSATSDSKALSQTFKFYGMPAAECGRQLEMLAASVGCGWRVLDTGKVWVGKEQWMTLENVDALTKSEAPYLGRKTEDIASPIVRPGQVVDGRHIGCVRYVLSEAGDLLMHTWEVLP